MDHDKYDFVESFRERLEKAMNLRDLSAADLSKRSGLSESLISGYRAGRQEPKREKVAILGRALNVSPIWLMGFNVPMIDVEIPKVQVQVSRLDAYSATIEEKNRILETARIEFARKYLTNDSMEVLAAYHNADQAVKSMVRKMLDLPAVNKEKRRNFKHVKIQEGQICHQKSKK